MLKDYTQKKLHICTSESTHPLHSIGNEKHSLINVIGITLGTIVVLLAIVVI